LLQVLDIQILGLVLLRLDVAGVGLSVAEVDVAVADAVSKGGTSYTPFKVDHVSQLASCLTNKAPSENSDHQQNQQHDWQLVKSKRVPPLFLPKSVKIQPLLNHFNANKGLSSNYTVKNTQEGTIRVQSKNMATYHKIITMLKSEDIEMYTHQLRKDRGFRIVIRHLPPTTDPKWIHKKLFEMGFSPCYVNVVKNRFSGKRLSLFEVEIRPISAETKERILRLESIGNLKV